MTIDFFNSEKILRLTPIIKETKKIADEILEGNVRVFPKLVNVKVQRLSELWEMKFETSPSTYALYVYALYPLSYLLNAYELTEDKRYLDKAVSLALDFLDWEGGDKKQINEKRSKILFGDHAVSNRTQALCYLLCCLTNAKCEVPEELTVALIRNGEYLADSKNYSHYNHGLMMDLALLGLLNTLEGLEIEHPPHLKESLMARLQHSITRDLTEDGVHVENSPGYHFWMLSFLAKATPALNVLDMDLYLKSKYALDKALEYAKYITRPDGSVPAIGDTHADLKHTPSKGLGSKFFQHANQVVFRSQDDSVWAHFTSGYKTHVHKHCDNGAFNLFHKGREILVDSGFLSYENDFESLAIKSTRFHNTVAPIGDEQNVRSISLSGSNNNFYGSNLSESKVLCLEKREGYEYAIGTVNDYSLASFVRVVVWVRGFGFFIYDKVISKHSSFSGFEQYFNLSASLNFENKGGVVRCRLDDSEVEIRQVLCEGKGGKGFSLEDAFVSVGFNSKAATKRAVSEVYGCRCLTQITINQEKEVTFRKWGISFYDDNRNLVDLDFESLLDNSISSGSVALEELPSAGGNVKASEVGSRAPLSVLEFYEALKEFDSCVEGRVVDFVDGIESKVKEKDADFLMGYIKLLDNGGESLHNNIYLSCWGEEEKLLVTVDDKKFFLRNSFFQDRFLYLFFQNVRDEADFFIVLQFVSSVSAIWIPSSNVLLANGFPLLNIKKSIVKFINDILANNSGEAEYLKKIAKFKGFLISTDPRPSHFFYEFLAPLMESKIKEMINRVGDAFYYEGADFLSLSEIFGGEDFVKERVLEKLSMKKSFYLNSWAAVQPGFKKFRGYRSNLARLDECLRSSFEVDKSYFFNDRYDLVLWFSICSEKRAWKEQTEFFSKVLMELIDSGIKPFVFFDSMTSTVSKYNFSSEDEAMARNIAALAGLSNFRSLNGESSAEKLRAASVVDFFVASKGTDSLYVSRIFNKMGVLHGGADIGRFKKHIYGSNTFLTPASISSVLPGDEVKLSDLQSYSISVGDMRKIFFDNLSKVISLSKLED